MTSSRGWQGVSLGASLLIAGLAGLAGAACLGEGADLDGEDRDGADAGRSAPDGSDVTTEAGQGEAGQGEAGQGEQRNDFPAVIVDPGTPATAAQVFAEADVAGAGPCLYEPQAGSLIPKNWPRLRFRQKVGEGENLFEIRLVVPNQKSPLVIHTNKASYTIDQATWTTLKTYGTGVIDISVRSATVDGQGKRTGGPWKGTSGQIEIAPVEARGTVSYFSTSDIAVKRFRIGDENVQAGPVPADVGTTCVGCHAPTPDGAHAALTTSAPGGGLALRPLSGGMAEPAFLTASARTLLARTDQHAAAFSKGHWTAGDRVLVSMFRSASSTEIIWTDLEAASTGQGGGWGFFARDGDPNEAASATVSHDGTKIAYVSSTGTTTGSTTSSVGRIAVIPWNARSGGPALFVTGAADPSAVQYYPSFSADDALLAFDKAASGSNYNNANAELFVVPPAGGTAHRLAANDPAACLATPSPGVTNSWPRWSPEVVTDGARKIYFVAFSSTRFGGLRQIFVAPVVVEGATVKSYPALYLWNQAEGVANHTPQWTLPLQ